LTRGEIWLVAYNDPPPAGEPAKPRPALIVSSNRLNATPTGSVITVPMTTRHRGLSIHVEVDGSGLDDISYAQADQVGVTSRSRLLHRIGAASAETMQAVDAELRSVLGL
jgi:mRNA interferase MazF